VRFPRPEYNSRSLYTEILLTTEEDSRRSEAGQGRSWASSRDLLISVVQPGFAGGRREHGAGHGPFPHSGQRAAGAGRGPRAVVVGVGGKRPKFRAAAAGQGVETPGFF